MGFIDESELDPIDTYGGSYVDEMELDPVSPSSTGSFGGDTLDFLGGLGKRAFEGLGTTIAAPIDLAATALASGIESAATGDLQWLEGQGLGDYFSGGLEDITGNIGEQSAAGRIGSNIGDLTGTAAGFILPAGAVSKGAGLLGKAGRFLSANPVRQLGLSAAGGLAGQSAVESGLVEEDGLGKFGIELGTMTAPDLLRAGLSAGKAAITPLRKRFLYENAAESSDEVLNALESVSKIDLSNPSTSQLQRALDLSQEIGGTTGIKRTAGEMIIEPAKENLKKVSSEISQLMDEAKAIKAQARFTGWTPESSERFKKINETLATIPKTITKTEESFPLLYEKYGEGITGVAPTATITEANPAYRALKNLESANKQYSGIVRDLTSVFKQGARGGKSFNAKDYEKASEKVGAALLSGKGVVAKDFVNSVDSISPEAGNLGKLSALEQVFKGDPKKWIETLNEKRQALTTLVGADSVKVLDDIAMKNRELVGGHMASYISGLVNKKIISLGLYAIGTKAAGPLAIPLIYGTQRVANAIANKPSDMVTFISRALVDPKARALLSQKANPRNLKLAKEYFLNAGKSAIMGKAADALDGDEDENIQMGDEIISEKKTEQIGTTPDVDLTPQTTELSPKLIKKVIAQESAFNPKAVSPKGAAGLMQLMPATGKEWHDKLGLEGEYDPFNEEQNKAIGTAYLGWLHDQFGGDTELALAAYNWGIGNMKKLLKRTGATSFDEIRSYLPSETKDYVRKITTGLEEI